METEENKKNDSILMKCSISKREVMDQVWIIYNETIPKTKNQSQVRGEYSQYHNPNRVNVEFKQDSREHVELKESESTALLRYEQFKESAKKDLEIILNGVCKPLLCYQNSKKIPQIPVLVAATFAAIWDMRKYNSLTPTMMLGIDEKEIEETIELLITPPLDYVMNYYDENEYFLRKIVENLKYFFNIEPEPHEINMGIVRDINYKILENEGTYIITAKKQKSDGKQAEIDKSEILREINEFKYNYVVSMKRQAKIKKKAGDLIKTIDNAIENYSGEEVEKVRSKLVWEVSKNYFYNSKDPFESSRVYPLDFTEPGFKDCHYMLDTELKRQLYGERNKKVSKLGKKNREYFEKNELLDEAGLVEREECLEKTIKEELKNLNETLYRRCQRRIDGLKIRSDKE